MPSAQDSLREEAERELDEEWQGIGSEGDQGSEGAQEAEDEDMLDGEDEDEDEDDGEDDEEEPPKDNVEEELERLVFGDEAGFQSEIHKYAQGEVAEVQEEENALAGIQDAELFFIDSGDTNVKALATTDEASDDLTVYGREPPAWEDSDDERMTISLMSVPRLRKLRTFEGEDVIAGKDFTRRLRRQYETLHPTPAWAQQASSAVKKRRLTEGDEGDSDADDLEDYNAQPLAELLRSTSSLTRTQGTVSNKRIKLRQETIGIERMKDIGPTQPQAIISLSIHPALPLVLSAGLSSTLYLHHLHPHPTPPDPANPLITSLHLRNTPLMTAAFSPLPSKDEISTTDPKIYLSGRRRYFHTWTLPTGQITKTTQLMGEQATTQRSYEVMKPSPCGKYIALKGSTRKGGGVINLLDSTTLQWISQAKIDSRGGVADFAWWQNGRGMAILGKDGEVTEWDVEQGRVIHRWHDEGQVGPTVIALGGTHPGLPHRKKRDGPMPLGTDRWVVTGSTAGIVNVYDRGSWDEQQPPVRPTPARTLENLTTPVSHLCFSPDGQLLAMSSRWKRDALRLVHLPSCTVYKNWPTSKTPLGRISAMTLGEWTDWQGARNGEDARRCLALLVGNEQGVLRGWEITG